MPAAVREHQYRRSWFLSLAVKGGIELLYSLCLQSEWDFAVDFTGAEVHPLSL